MAEDSVRIPITDKVLYENSSLVEFFSSMEYVLNLRRSLMTLRDAALRDTDALEEQQRKMREGIMTVAEKLLVKRIEYELDLALAHLENYFEQLS